MPEAKLLEARNAQNWSIGEAKKFGKRATDAATQLSESVRRITKVEESAKLSTEKRATTELQVARSLKTAKDVLRRLTDLLRRVELLEE